MAWYYTFEAKEIQSFILQSDKLREMVGGSDLVARLCGSFLDDALKAVGVAEPGTVIIATASGWARMKFEDGAQAQEFARCWPLIVSRFAPGLKLIQACFEISGTLPEAVKRGMDQLRGARNLNDATLPEVGPLIERNPRTGMAAVDAPYDKKAAKNVPIDRQTKRKRDNSEMGALVGKITNGFLPAADIPKQAWPYEIENIASEKSAYVAVIHADGNDLGSTLMQIGSYLKSSPDEAEAVYRELTEVIDRITVSAVQSAVEKTLFNDYRAQVERGDKAPCIAARPIVLGGDDLTMIVRADLAAAFTAEFLAAFERTSKELLSGLRTRIKEIPEVLTACAGIAYIKKSYPFSSAYRMAESLCEHTKKVAKLDRDSRRQGGNHVPVPSSFTFYRISTSMAEGFSEVKEQELTGRGLFDAKPVRFWYGPYAIGGQMGALPQYSALGSLMNAIELLPSGSIRTLISTMHTDPVSARKDYARILQVAEKDKGAGLTTGLLELTGNRENPLWNSGQQTPLADAHLLCEINKGGVNA